MQKGGYYGTDIGFGLTAQEGITGKNRAALYGTACQRRGTHHAESPAAVVMELSRQKAEEIAAAQTGDCIIIGADTVVAKGEKIMGKPKDAADAKQMLRSIADDCHQVYTGVTLIRTGAHPQSVTFQEKTDVFLYPISDAEADAYIASGDPMDKAGAYGIQGDFAIYVKRIVGDYYNVVGLPIGRVYQELKRMLFVKK